MKSADSWTPTKVRQIGRIYGGLSGKKKDDFGKGNALYVTFLGVLENISIGREATSQVNVGVHETQNRVLKGDLLFNATSETPGEVAMGAVVRDDIPNLFLNSFCFGLRLHDPTRHHASFLAYLSRGGPGRTAIRALAQGATRYNISKTQFRRIAFAIPPPREQRDIAELLSDVDRLIDSLDALIAKKRVIRAAVIQQLLIGAVRLPGFSGRWASKSLSEVGTFSRGGYIRRDQLSQTGLPCVLYGEIYTRYSDYTAHFTSRIHPDIAVRAIPIRTGDVLFAGSGETAEEIGRCTSYIGEATAYAGGDILVFSPSGQNSVYLGCLLNSPAMALQKARLAQGHAVVHIGARSLEQISLVLPKLDEQEAVASVIMDFDAEIEKLEQRQDKTRALKQGMMQQLFTGRTRLLARQTSTPEPATT